MAVGGSVTSTVNGGTSWQLEAMPPIANSDALVGVSCVSTSLCWVDSQYGRLFRSLDGGKTWTDQSQPNVQYMEGISCLSGGFCVAVATGSAWFEALYTTDGGVNWTAVRLNSPYGFMSVSCVTTTDCWIAGGQVGPNCYSGCATHAVVAVTHDGGHTWTIQSKFPSLQSWTVLPSISCFDIDHCVAVGLYQYPGDPPTPIVVSTVDGGMIWQVDRAPQGPTELTGVSCFSMTSCLAVAPTSSKAGTVIATTDGGGTWSTEFTTSAGVPDAINCPSSANCWAVGRTTANPTSGFALNASR